MTTAKPTPNRTATQPLACLRSTKIGTGHLGKLAIVYVRQSSPQQVLHNRESTARQYALAGYAESLGWPADRVLVIDEDQGQSGATAEHRSGFQRLLAEVTMDHVGLVLGLEMSRLARSCKDWHHLLELCAVFGVLLSDQDGTYDPNDPNDRLLLGLRGTISEVELHTMRNRLNRGRDNKAQRGELFFSVPLGYVRLPTGRVDFDPDEQARSVVKLIFEKFDEIGTVRGVFYWFIQHDIKLPIRSRSGANKGLLEWRRPNLGTLTQVIHHPMYGGTYAYGRRPLDSQRSRATGKPRQRKFLPMDQWQVLIPDRVPAYITWDGYLKNQDRLKQNQCRSDTLGSPRMGNALLCGLLTCGRCEYRLQVAYSLKSKAYYRCLRHLLHVTKKTCCDISANEIDAVVAEQVLRALEPAALELSLKAQADLRRERDRLDKHWKQSLQRARYTVELAERRYQAVDPDNRLVAATLERQWDEALQRERALKEDYDRSCQQRPSQLGADDMARIVALGADIPALWHAPATTNVDRQGIVRCLVERVVVHVAPDNDRAEAVIYWIGGHESRHAFERSVRRYEQCREFDRLMKRIVELRTTGNTADRIATALNQEGFTPLRRERAFTQQVVYDLLRRCGFHEERNNTSLLGTNEWHLTALAQRLKMSRLTLWNWAAKGWVHSRRSAVQKVVIVWADDDEVKRLKKLLASGWKGIHGYPSELITPKARKKCQ